MVPESSGLRFPNHGLSFLVINDGCTQPKENQPISRRFVGKEVEVTDKQVNQSIGLPLQKWVSINEIFTRLNRVRIKPFRVKTFEA